MNCSLCSRPFRRKDKLTEHMRHAHSTSDLDSTKGKAPSSDFSMFSDSDWQSSSTFLSSREEASTDRISSLDEEHVMDGVKTPMDLQSYSLFSEQWNTWPEEWQSPTAKSLQLQIDDSETATCIDASESLPFSTDHDLCDMSNS